MPSYYPNALVFKEWRLMWWYLAFGIFLFSLGPLMGFVMSLSTPKALIQQSPDIIVQNVMSINLPGLGFLLIIFSAGLALLTLSEFFQRIGIQLACEPVSLRSVLFTKFAMGIGTIVFSQTVSSLWIWGALTLRHAAVSFLVVLGWWLVCTVLEVTFFAVTFVLLLVVRPVVIAILLMCAILVAPLYAAELFWDQWKSSLSGGGFLINAPRWAEGWYYAIRCISPYGIIHYGPDTMARLPGYLAAHAVEPLGWVILSLATVSWIGRCRTVAQLHSSNFLSMRQHRRGMAIVRAMSTLCAAIIVEHYVVHIEIVRLSTKVEAVLFLWLCCHWFVRAFIGYRDSAERKKAWKIKGAEEGARS